MAPDCRLRIGGEWFADTAAALAAGVPTALADLELLWGRGTTVDQPDAATVRVSVVDRAGGATLIDALPIGAPLEVWAGGDIGTGAPSNVAVDGGFEAAPLGPAGNRATLTPAGAPATLTIVGAPTHAGARALELASMANLSLAALVPPAAFAPGNPPAWDAIPRLGASTWQWSLAVLAARSSASSVTPTAFDGPEDVGAAGGALGGPVTVAGDGTWHVVAGTAAADAGTADAWPGVTVTTTLAPWPNVAGSWLEAPGSWREYGRTVTDDLVLEAPPSVLRDVLVFAGRITDLAATVNAGTATVDVIAVDQRADLENRYAGAAPWPAEALTARVAHVLEGAALTDVDTRIDAPLGAEVVSWRDVDRQPAGSLLTELAAGVDGVLWSATHATLGAFLWFENVALRVALGTLELVGGVVVIVVDTTGNRPSGRTELDGCQIGAEGVTWRRDVTDVLTRIDATWLEQTTPPTERTVTVVNAPAEVDAGSRRMGVATNLTTAAAAEAVADRILARTRIPQWRAEGLTVDTELWPPGAGADTATVLDLLDGTTRLGRGLIITNIDGWPGGDSAGAYLDGGSYTYDGAWRLALATSPMGGFGASAPWDSLEPAWAWSSFSPDLAWSDLFGVTGPLQLTEVA